MDAKIETAKSQPLPTVFVILVYIASTGVGAFFGNEYKAPGILTAGVGGLIAGIVWCKVMGRLYVAMKIKWGWFLLAGIGLGIFVGVADGILLNIAGVTLHRIGYIYIPMVEDFRNIDINSDYSFCLLLGSIFGVFGGFLNGLFWSIIATVMYNKKKSNHAASMDLAQEATDSLSAVREGE